MEVIVGSFHAEFPMEDASRVGEARRHACQVAQACGLDDVEVGRVALVMTELGNNLVRHAKGGRLMVSARPARQEIEVIAMDSGPGIADVARCLGDGYSTGGTPGTGLGAVRRLSQDFDIHSSVPGGTFIVARLRPASAPAPAGAIEVAAVSRPAPGERVCGDGWAFALDGDRASVLLADGLGHGPDAAAAAHEAIEAFREDPMAAPRTMLQQVHGRLRTTRGAAVSMAQVDAAEGTVRSAGAGNVIGRLVSGVSDRTLLGQHGTAGVTIRTPEETRTAWPPHALVVFYSDGIESRWKPELLAPVLGRDPAIAAALLLREHCRGHDDATVAVLRRRD